MEPPWRVSSGTAAVLGLSQMRMDAAPTTAYLMLGERCSRNCAFCTQARDSRADPDALSRVVWPAFGAEDVAEAVGCAYRDGTIARACFQVTITPGYLQETEQAILRLAQCCDLPICTSVMPRRVDDVASLLGAGAERVTIALDAACERVYRAVKGGSWAQTKVLVESCARLHPGRISTHLIVGLGETEKEMVERIQELDDRGVTIGLFAFTPVDGTAMALHHQPHLGHYRRMQVALWLIVNKVGRAEDFAYRGGGRLAHYGSVTRHLPALLASGEAFRTSGCPRCNRPYYNERPGGVLYNYPRPLAPEESEREIETLTRGLAQ